MLLKNPTIPLDLMGNLISNQIAGELHSVTDGSSAIFCLTKGPFYLKDLVVTNDITGATLVINQDYKPIQLYEKATEKAGRDVYCCIQVLVLSNARVRVSYRAMGGEFQSMLPVLLEMRDQVVDGFIPTTPYSRTMNTPQTFTPAEHNHPFSDLTDLDAMFPALYHILTNLFISQRSQYTVMYAYMESALVAKAASVMQQILALTQSMDVMENASRIGHLDIKITDNANPPQNYLGYGDWVLLPPSIPYGAAMGDAIGSMFGLATGVMPNALNARRTYMWQLVSQNVDMAIVVTADRTTMNEGDSVTFTVTSPGRVPGTAFTYHLTGLAPQDVVGNQLSGTLILDEVGSASLTVTVVEDMVSDPGHFIRFNLGEYPRRFAQIPVNDTSVNVGISAYYAQDALGNQRITVATEGTEAYLIIKTTNVQDGTVFYIAYDGSTVTNQQILAALPTMVSINNNVAYVPILIASDHITEGSTTLIAWIGQIAGVNNANIAARMRIKDTSKNPTYHTLLTSDSAGTLQVSTANEAASFFLQINTTDVPDGTQLALAYVGDADTSRFSSMLPAFVTITSGYGRVEFDVKADGISESTESFVVNVLANGVIVATEQLYINDTSQNINAAAQFSTNQFATNTITDMNEGQAVYFVAQVAGYPDGTALPLVYGGSPGGAGAVAQSRFSAAWPQTLTVTNGSAYALFNVLNDQRTVGDKYFRITVLDPTGTNQVCRATILIHDTSKQPIYALRFTSDQNGTLPIAQCNEGDKIYVFVSSQNLPLIATLGVDVSISGLPANTTGGRVTTNPARFMTLVNGTGSIPITIKADNKTEGDTPLQVNVRASTAVNDTIVASGTLTIHDTSRDPVISCKFSSLPDGSDDITGQGILHNQTVYLVITSANITPGTTYWMNYTGNAANQANQADILTTLPSYVVIQQNVQIMPLTIKENYTPGASASMVTVLQANFYADSLLTIPVMNTNIQIVEPVFQLKFSPLSSGVNQITRCNEGDTIYLVMNSGHLLDGSTLSLQWFIDGTVVTGNNSDLVQTITHQITVENNLVILPLTIALDSIPDGTKLLQVQLYGANFTAGQAPLAVANVTMVDTSVGGVTAIGTYGAGSIGTLTIPALGTRLITLTGGGASGAMGILSDPESPAAEGMDGQPTTLTYGGSVLFTSSSGKAGNRISGGGHGGMPTSNQTAITNAASIFSITNPILTTGGNAPIGVNTGAVSVSPNGTGAGANGNLDGSGGGSGGVTQFRVTNTTNALLSLAVAIGGGGLRVQGLTAQTWNDGSLVIAS